MLQNKTKNPLVCISCYNIGDESVFWSVLMDIWPFPSRTEQGETKQAAVERFEPIYKIGSNDSTDCRTTSNGSHECESSTDDWRNVTKIL